MSGEQLQENARLLKLVTAASVATALILITVKLVAWHLTGAASLLASLVDSLMDLAASAINLLAVRYSLKGADRDHRFGHGKAESLAGLAQASFIAGSAVFLAIYTVNRLLNPRDLDNLDAGLGVMIFALALTIALVIFQRRVVRRTGSVAIKADSLHYVTDILASLVTIAALLLAQQGWLRADPLLALGIALYILYSAGKIVHEAIQHLMDRELAEEIKSRIREIALSEERVLGFHDLRTRQSGQTKIIQFHLDLAAHLPLFEAHAICRRIQRRLEATFPGADITIHQDPANLCTPWQTTGHNPSCGHRSGSHG
ncbi:cation diffusion facilitator family transporter [Desulfurivibrio sp. D14AmB]|uniref:cation diffusion facilitator family transporter n=1 Tax=Desulfurivibrio sp. D14AmB TaxID=3374370 RepID=UPI00376EF223